MKGWGLIFLLLGVSFIVASGIAGGWVSGTGEVDISRSVVNRIDDYEYYSTMAGDGSLQMGHIAKGSKNLEKGIFSGGLSLSYSGDIPLVGVKRIETGSPFRGTKTTFQEAFSATEMEREEMTRMGSSVVATDTKLAFNGTYVTSSNSHQAFVRDISSHQRYTGTFEINNMIQFGSLADRRPALAVTILPQECFAEAGALVTRNYAVVNTGTVPVRGLDLVDSRFGPVLLSRTELSPGEVATGSLSFPLGEEALPGPQRDSVVVTAVDFQGNVAEATATATVNLIPARGLNLTVKACEACVRPGEIVTYVYAVENSGDLPIFDINLTDSISSSPIAVNLTLMPGEGLNLTTNRTVREADLPGPLKNVVSAAGINSEGELVGRTREVILLPC